MDFMGSLISTIKCTIFVKDSPVLSIYDQVCNIAMYRNYIPEIAKFWPSEQIDPMN